MPTNLYGEKDNFHLENSHVIPALLSKFHEAKVKGSDFVEVWGSGQVMREFMHVDDLAKACLFMMQLEVDSPEYITLKKNIFIQSVYLSSIILVCYVSGERMAFATFSLSLIVLFIFLNGFRKSILLSILIGTLFIFLAIYLHPFYNVLFLFLVIFIAKSTPGLITPIMGKEK